MRGISIVLLIVIAAVVSADEPLTEPPITDSDRGHWAFQPLSRPTPPTVQDANWCRTAIDRFILARLEKERLSPAGEADRATLLRRVCFDLTGLPPSLELQDEVFADESPDWYERLVDRLLASPSYGERWAQHWLDVARFAETDGFEHDHVRPNAWRFRDWVIDAHNRDVPLNEFIGMQLAGDELRPGDESALIATGFLFCGPDMPDINLQEERRHTFLNDMTGTVGSVFLGLQMGCAACHDHKYDPISQADFYRLRACFDVEPLFETHPRLGQVMREKSSKTPTSRLFERGDFRRPGPVVKAAFPRIANVANDAIASPADDAKSSGRRTSLANWLTRADNPLATRVLINRIWQGHFGTGLVASSSDFGVMGTSPTHPELLDWLATELPQLDWSRKRLHRLIVTSSVYRQAGLKRGEGRGARGEQDRTANSLPSNSPLVTHHSQLLSPFPRRRLDGEAIRDSLLAASGELNRQPDGPGFRPPLPDELVRTLLKSQWPVTPEVDQHRRRSVYLFARRNLR
ncbi:MAG: signal peptide protein, partial [Planctomycetota bacterium]